MPASRPSRTRPVRRGPALLSATLLVVGGATTAVVAAPSPAHAETCLPQLPPLPPICLPDLPGLPGVTLTATTPVAITGTPKVGETLTATPPTWDDSAATTTYQWQSGGTAIDGATDPTYDVRVADIGQAITVVATGTSGLKTGTSTSDPVTGQKGAAPKPKGTITLTGTRKVGQTLTVHAGTWTGADKHTYSYQWYRIQNRTATKINGATKTTYRLAKSEGGRSVTVLVTAASDGYDNGYAISQIVEIPKVKKKKHHHK